MYLLLLIYYSGRIVHLRVVTKTLSEAVKEFKKKPIIIVEDIDSVKGNTPAINRFLLYMIE